MSEVIINNDPIIRDPILIIAIGKLKYLVLLNHKRKYTPKKMPFKIIINPGTPRSNKGLSSIINLSIAPITSNPCLTGFFFDV